MQLLHVASEVFPFSRSGGLADVLSALPALQARLLKAENPEHSVTVISPWYASLQQAEEVQEIWRGELPELAELGSEVWLGELWQSGVRYLFVGMEEFQREGRLYHDDDVWRFSLFGRAILPLLRRLDAVPTLLHGHDWQSALAVAYAHLNNIRTVFTIHNLQYQGRWNLGDGRYWSGLPDWMFSADGLEFYGDINHMKAGLCFADHITTVSPTYAQEITTTEYGYGLEGVLIRRTLENRLTGILNGIDEERWNPQTDPYITNYDNITGKREAISVLRKELDFSKNYPIMTTVSRLADQKGMDLLIESLHELVKDWQIVILGGGDSLLMAALRGWAQHPRVRYFAGLNEELAHRLYAGAHAFVMPSRFEPCGLSQMIAMRYGTLPIVRYTGGLRDTVPDNVGFHFQDTTPQALQEACQTARQTYKNRSAWKQRAERAMQLNHSWQSSAQHYLDLYWRICNG